MADVLNVIADIIKQDKQQKREHAKVMREVQKKLKEKEVDTTEDNADFMGAASQAAADGKKEFEFPPGSGKMYPVTIKDKDTAKKIAKKMDDEDEQEETSLGDRVKARMKAEEEEDGDDGVDAHHRLKGGLGAGHHHPQVEEGGGERAELRNLRAKDLLGHDGVGEEGDKDGKEHELHVASRADQGGAEQVGELDLHQREPSVRSRDLDACTVGGASDGQARGHACMHADGQEHA